MTEIGPTFHSYDDDWMVNAACAPLAGLPWTHSRPHPRAVIAMQEVCAACPVRAACEDYAIATDVTAGWWAGRNFSKYHIHYLPRDDFTHQGGDAA